MDFTECTEAKGSRLHLGFKSGLYILFLTACNLNVCL